MHAAIGIRVHSGWAALTVVALDEGLPRVLWRERPRLVETFTFEFRQPYHTAERATIEEAREIVLRARGEAARLAREAIGKVEAGVQAQGYELRCCGLLLASGKPLPSLERILASHALIHTADGELFRDALLEASADCGLVTFTLKESELFATASRELGPHPEEIQRRVAGLGSVLGPPWAQDEKRATLVAWLALVRENVN